VVPSGNNLIFRVTRDADDWAVKFTIRDERNRARREFKALRLLESLDVPVVPRPIYFDQEQFRTRRRSGVDRRDAVKFATRG
jgi:hypothetical protein